jgi:hypothetical protein
MLDFDRGDWGSWWILVLMVLLEVTFSLPGSLPLAVIAAVCTPGHRVLAAALAAVLGMLVVVSVSYRLRWLRHDNNFGFALRDYMPGYLLCAMGAFLYWSLSR